MGEDDPTVYHLVIPSSDGRSLLVDMQDKGPFLPRLVARRRDEDSCWVNEWNIDTLRLIERIVSFLHLRSRVYVRHPLWKHPNSKFHEEWALVVDLLPGDQSTTSASVPGFEWLSWEAALKAEWRPLHESCDTLAMLTSFFDQTLHVGDPSSRPPWRRAGWFLDITTWVRSVLPEHGFELASELLQERNMFQSSVLRCKVRNSSSASTSNCCHSQVFNGYVYIKTTIPSSPEALITSTLSSVMGAFVPKVLETDKDNITFIQLGVKDLDLEDSTMLDGLAKMQLHSLEYIDALKSGGVPDRGLMWLSTNIKSLMEGPLFRLFPHNRHLLELQSRVGEITDICRILMGFGIPHTLVHGDCDESNFVVGAEAGSKVSFIDWETACIAYPLYDYIRLIHRRWEPIKDQVLRDSYLNHWLDFESRDNILKAVVLAFPLTVLYNVFTLLRICFVMEPLEQPLMVTAIRRRFETILDGLNDAWSRAHNESEEKSKGNTYYLIIPNQTGEMILVFRSDGHVNLPVVSPPTTGTSVTVQSWEKDPHNLRVVANNAVGCDCWIVRPMWARSRSADDGEAAVLLAELLDNCVDMPKGFEWVPVRDIPSVGWRAINEGVKPEKLVEEFFNGTPGAKERNHQPRWRSLGWFQDVTQWVEAALRKNGLVVGPIRQERTSFQSAELSCSVRQIDADDSGSILESSETVYVRASLPHLSEAKWSFQISSFSCGIVPKIIEVCEKRNIVIQEGVGESDEMDFDEAEVMKYLAELQLRSVSHLSELKGCGILVFNSEWVLSNVAHVLSDPVLDSCSDKESVIGLRLQIADIERHARELEAFNIPETLVHGEFRAGNFGRRKDTGGYCFLRWGSCFVGHPFCDLAMLSRMRQRAEINLKAAKDSYFGFWEKYGTQAELRRASQLSFVIYWVINLHRLLQFYEMAETPEKVCIMEKLNGNVCNLIQVVSEVGQDIRQRVKLERGT